MAHKFALIVEEGSTWMTARDIRAPRDIIVNAKTPLAAAKKIWRMEKHLSVIEVRNVMTCEEHYFQASEWMAHSRKGRRKFK